MTVLLSSVKVFCFIKMEISFSSICILQLFQKHFKLLENDISILMKQNPQMKATLSLLIKKALTQSLPLLNPLPCDLVM